MYEEADILILRIPKYTYTRCTHSTEKYYVVIIKSHLWTHSVFLFNTSYLLHKGSLCISIYLYYSSFIIYSTRIFIPHSSFFLLSSLSVHWWVEFPHLTYSTWSAVPISCLFLFFISKGGLIACCPGHYFIVTMHCL